MRGPRSAGRVDVRRGSFDEQGDHTGKMAETRFSRRNAALALEQHPRDGLSERHCSSHVAKQEEVVMWTMLSKRTDSAGLQAVEADNILDFETSSRFQPVSVGCCL